MPEFLLALLLIVAMMVAYSILVRALVHRDGPAYRLSRRARMARVVRRETADLDRRYEQLLRSAADRPGGA